MGYGFSAIALPQLKEVASNAFGRNEFARSYYQPFTIDDETGSWIGMCNTFLTLNLFLFVNLNDKAFNDIKID